LEILDLRHFSSMDLRPLLGDETQLWSRQLSWDYSGSAEMILRYVDAKILPGYAAVDRGRVFGYSFFVYEGSKGVIGDLYVINGTRLPNAREVELKLLTHVIETLQQSPGIHRVEAQLLAHEANSVSRPFLETGFQRHPRLFMTLPLGKAALEKVPTHPEVEIRPWTDSDYQPSAAVITAAYRNHVDAQINDQYHTERVAALSQQHCAVSGMRSVRRRVVVRGARSQSQEFDRTDPVLARPPRCRACDAGVRAPGVSVTGNWRIAARSHRGESAKAKICSVVTDRDRGERAGRCALS